MYLLVAGNHYQLVRGRRYVCGITKDIVSIKDKKVKRRARVTEVYELVADAKIVIPQEARKPKTKRNDNHRARAQRHMRSKTCCRDGKASKLTQKALGPSRGARAAWLST